jgi:subtilisin family serine protease
MKETISFSKSILISTISFFSLSSFAADHNLIVKWTSNKDHLGCKRGEAVFEALNLYESSCDEEAYSKLKKSRANSYILNSKVSFRKAPNDPRFNELWNFLPGRNNADVSAQKAWDLSVGNRNGEEFVVAVIDGGVDVDHEDLKDNIWINKAEIPGNSIDDDGNGYIDDINGWNAFNDSGEIDEDYHGTHVAGIIGAKGNNSIGVTGINWDIKIMGISGSSGDTKTVLKAYNYVLKQKLLYLKSGGKLGANIVSTNSSFGVDFADCKSKDYRLWNDVYTELGKAGILNAAATINDEINVDVEGDVPTGCDSDSIITVTNTNNDNEKYQYSGYGEKSIDLGAPGTDILSTVPGDSYANLTGTSMSTPHIAGAIAFLHGLENEKFKKIRKDNPSQAVRLIKSALIESVDKNPTLNGKTLSGGRLNLFKSSKWILNLR